MEAKRKSLLPVKAASVLVAEPGYDRLLSDISGLLEQARRTSARTVNSILTATYWEIGRRIIEFEQSGFKRAEYGERLLNKLASDLTGEYGRGFSRTNLQQMRIFYLGWKICQTASGKSECRVTALDADGKRDKSCSSMLLDRGFVLPGAFPLSWSHYVRLMSVTDPAARAFYERLPGESDPVGIILCGGKNEAVVRYATGGIKAKVFASRYLTVLPDEETLKREILKTRRLLEARRKEIS
jgi:hypothetical protein